MFSGKRPISNRGVDFPSPPPQPRGRASFRGGGMHPGGHQGLPLIGDSAVQHPRSVMSGRFRETPQYGLGGLLSLPAERVSSAGKRGTGKKSEGGNQGLLSFSGRRKS